MINFDILTTKEKVMCLVRGISMGVLSGAVVGVIATAVTTLLEG